MRDIITKEEFEKRMKEIADDAQSDFCGEGEDEPTFDQIVPDLAWNLLYDREITEYLKFRTDVPKQDWIEYLADEIYSQG